jgi:hypothetical protein
VPTKAGQLHLPSGRCVGAYGPSRLSSGQWAVSIFAGPIPAGLTLRDLPYLIRSAKGVFVGELPTGTVTFLFTDLEHSTPLWEEQPQAMQPVLARHDEVLAGAVGAAPNIRLSENRAPQVAAAGQFETNGLTASTRSPAAGPTPPADLGRRGRQNRCPGPGLAIRLRAVPKGDLREGDGAGRACLSFEHVRD